VGATRRRSGRRSQGKAAETRRFTVDASVFVNAFNPHETGHAASLAFLTSVQQRADPIIVPALLLVEIGAAVSRATDDTGGALAYVHSLRSPFARVVDPADAGARVKPRISQQHIDSGQMRCMSRSRGGTERFSSREIASSERAAPAP
jgi:hypothetical protein